MSALFYVILVFGMAKDSYDYEIRGSHESACFAAKKWSSLGIKTSVLGFVLKDRKITLVKMPCGPVPAVELQKTP